MPAAAHAAESTSVDVALVIVDDVSGSINDAEFDLQKQGYLAAFTDPRVIAAIKGGPNGAIAVRYVEFASAFEVKNVLDWAIIRDEATRARLRPGAARRAALLPWPHRDRRGHRPRGAGHHERGPRRAAQGDRCVRRRDQQFRARGHGIRATMR